MDRPVDRLEVDLADQQTSRHEDVDYLNEHHGELAGKPMQVSKSITVDGITGGGL